MPSVGQLVEVLKGPSKSGLRDCYLLGSGDSEV